MSNQNTAEKDDLERTIALLYEKMLADEALKPFFQDVDISHLKRKQKWLLTSILMANTAGTADYMRSTHAQLVKKSGLNENHFNRMVKHLNTAAQEANLPKKDQQTLMKGIERLRGPVLGKADINVCAS